MRRLLALLLVLGGLGLAAGLVVTYNLDAHRTEQAQTRLLADVPQGPALSTVSAPEIESTSQVPPGATPVDYGKGLLVMRIPRFGADWEWVVSEGTSPDVLDGGPGHYPQSVLPGEIGNTAFAGHRSGHGNPFIDFDRLQVGDEVILEQGASRWVYVIDESPRIIPIDASWVLDPTASSRDVTLTTCWPKYGSSKRMFVRGHLMEG